MLSLIASRKTGASAVRGLAASLAILVTQMPHSALADTAMTAGVVMEKMPARERYAFVEGVVHGLAYARFQKDNKQPEGMQCLYDWFHAEGGRTIRRIEQAFQNFPDYPPGSIIGVMANKECGE